MRNLMHVVTGRRLLAFSMTTSVALGFAGVAGATTDANLTSASSSLTGYFSDNLPVVIGAFVLIAMSIWVLSLLFKSVGVKKPNKVG